VDNRELATFIILAGAVLAVVAYGPTRTALIPVLQALKWKLLFTLGLFGVWVGAGVWFAASIGLWSTKVWAATVLWFVLVGARLFFNMNKVGQEDNYIRRQVLEAVGIGALFEFFLNVQPFALWIEVPLLLFIAAVATLDAYAWSKEEFRPAGVLTRTLLALTTLVIVISTIVRLVSQWDRLDPEELVQDLLLPVWMTLVTVPFIFLLALISEYEAQFIRLSIFNGRKRPKASVVLAIILGLGLSPKAVHKFRAPYAQKVARGHTFGEAAAHIEKWKAQSRRDETELLVNRWRLERFAGDRGTDVDGRRNDRREFAATKSALHWIAVCQSAWYESPEGGMNRYRPDILQLLNDFEQQGLSGDHGIVLKTRTDGQAWYAWRKTVTGWIFGIGGTGPPPSEWYYDGPVKPGRYPPGVEWTSFMEPVRPEWKDEPPV
jgi:hypothetical protein